MLEALDCYRMNELGLDTKIPKNGLKIYPEILQKMSINPNFISKSLEIDSIYFRNNHL